MGRKKLVRKAALKSKSESEEASGPWRPTKWQMWWAICMVVALLTTALLIDNLRPEIWKDLLEERNLKLIAIGVSLTAIIVLLAIGGAKSRWAKSRWTGFRGMTLRDWLPIVGALLVPVVVALGTWWITWQLAENENQRAKKAQKIEGQRAKAERKLAEQRAQDEVVQAYLSQMSQLMLERKLLEAEQSDSVYTLAQARTSTAILRLDAEHNESVIRFLSDSGLAESDEPSVSLLRGIALEEANLMLVDLQSTDLSDANLLEADLRGADLRGANLRETLLPGAELRDADLLGTDLLEANLRYADLRGADLRGAKLRGAALRDADLSRVDLNEAAGITIEELEQQAASLEGATMPNGKEYRGEPRISGTS